MLDRHREQAAAVVRRAVGGVIDAEDCVQDAIIRLAGREDLDPTRVRALLTRTALHLAIDQLRARRREERALARLGSDLPRQTVSPEEVAGRRAEVARALAAVDRLPRRERQVMLLRLSGLSVMETAKLLGLSYKSVEGMYTRARARVRLTLGAVLAWLSGKLRRASSPRGETLAAAVAVFFLAGPLWHNVQPGVEVARVPAASIHPVAAGGGNGHNGGGSGAPHAVLAAQRDRPGDRASGAGHSGPDHHRQPPFFTTGPVSLPEPTGPSGQPPLIYFGGITVSGNPPDDPVGYAERCIERGYTVSVTYGGCTKN